MHDSLELNACWLDVDLSWLNCFLHHIMDKCATGMHCDIERGQFTNSGKSQRRTVTENAFAEKLDKLQT